MVYNQKPFEKGYNMLTEENGLHKDMIMDIGVYYFIKNEKKVFISIEKETAFLLLDGAITIEYKNKINKCVRASIFKEKPTCLHVPKNTTVTIIAQTDAEVLIQKTTNEKNFEPVFYKPDNIEEVILGDHLWQNTGRRILRDIFNYNNAPYSNMVLGEIINLPGRWSSYPPHHHRQPEVYYYKFDKPEGFGCSVIGDEVYKITDRSISVIPGGLCHPQVAAPGYAMFYVWMIRHFDNDPWNERIFDPDHEWLLDNKAEIFEPNEN